MRLSAAFGGAVIVGLVVAATGELRFPARAVLQTVGRVPAAQAAALPDRLVSFLASVEDSGPGPHAEAQTPRQPGEPTRLVFTVLDTTPDKSLDRARSLADRFLEAISTEVRQARSAPTAAEQFASRQFEELQRDAAAVSTRLDEEREALDTAPSPVDHEPLLSQWRELHARYRAASKARDEAESRLSRLLADGEPTSATVSDVDRAAAEAADLALQQDLKETAVNLAVLKSGMLEVRRRVGSRLEPTRTAVDTLHYEARRLATQPSDPEVQSAVTGLAVHASRYQDLLNQFVNAWDREFGTIPPLVPDPARATLLGRYDPIVSAARRFMEEAEQQLQAMETEMATLQRDSSAIPQRHDLISTLLRSVQTLRASHHRLVAEAGQIDASANFRIDAALRSARGLHTRSRARMAAIKQRLRDEALANARSAYAVAVEQARDRVAVRRDEFDKVADALVKTHAGLIEAMADAKDTALAETRAELLASQLGTEEQRAERIKTQLEQMSQARRSAAVEEPLELVSVSSRRLPADTRRRLQSGGIAAVATFAAILLTQLWFIHRRATPG